jgi:hypothetical protein
VRSEATSLPAGTLEGLVLDDDVPCRRRGSLELARNWHPHLLDDAMPVPADVRFADLGSDARFRYEGLAPGEYGLRLTLDGGPRLSTVATVPEGGGDEMVLRIGASSLWGFVWDDEGAPVEGAVVIASRKTGENFRTTTGADGRYEHAFLESGPYWLTVETARGAGREKSLSQVRLALRETRRFDWGEPRPRVQWRGSLRAANGGAHLGGAMLFLQELGEDPAHTFHSVGPDGSFDLRLVPGRYAIRAQLHPLDDSKAELDEVEVRDGQLERDLFLPGARLSGRVLRVDGGPLPDGPDSSIAARNEERNRMHTARIEPDGHFAIDALEPGVYVVNAHPLVLDGGVDSLRVEILPGVPEVVLDIPVRLP